MLVCVSWGVLVLAEGTNQRRTQKQIDGKTTENPGKNEVEKSGKVEKVTGNRSEKCPQCQLVDTTNQWDKNIATAVNNNHEQ